MEEGIDEYAMPGEYVDICSIVERLAVDQGAVAIENDIEHCSSFDVIKRSSMTFASRTVGVGFG